MAIRRSTYRSSAIVRSEQGAIIVLMSVALVSLLAAVALAVVGLLLVTSRLEQNINAEQVALAAMKTFVETSDPSQRVEKALQRAEEMGAFNTLAGNRSEQQVREGELQNHTAGVVVFGTWAGLFNMVCGDTPPGCTLDCNAVHVELRTQPERTMLSFGFQQFLGVETTNIRSAATVYYDESNQVFRIVKSGPTPYS